MTPRDQLLQALQAPRALEEVHRVLQGLAASGEAQLGVYKVLRTLLEEARESMGEDEEFVLLQALDLTCGFCPPEHKLWDQELPRLHSPGDGPTPV
jgi:hypothetical protein